MQISFHRGSGRPAPIEYRFPAYVAEHYGVTSALDLKHEFFAKAGVENMPRENCRRLLRGEFRSIQFELWTLICDIAHEPLSTFFEYSPGAPPPRAERPLRRLKPARATGKTPRTAAVKQLRAVPAPSAEFQRLLNEQQA